MNDDWMAPLLPERDSKPLEGGARLLVRRESWDGHGLLSITWSTWASGSAEISLARAEGIRGAALLRMPRGGVKCRTNSMYRTKSSYCENTSTRTM